MPRRLLPALFIAALLGSGCGGGASATGAGPSPIVTATPTQPDPTGPAGPTDYAAWVETQGFGGSDGLNEVHKIAQYVFDHAGFESGFNLTADIAVPSRLTAWLDGHPATACWTTYHTKVRALLGTVLAGYTSAEPVVKNGGPIPTDTVNAILAAAAAAEALPAPANCP